MDKVKQKLKAGKKAKEQPPYLTKRILVSAAKRGIRKAAEETMQVMGYNVIAREGWVVKIFADGTIEKLSPIETVNLPNGILHD